MSYLKDKLIPGYTGKFVIQLHKAERAHKHFDLRLEFPVDSVSDALGTYKERRPAGKSPEPQSKKEGEGTVFRSWAVPKHHLPTSKPLLATETENHAIEYGSFKGTIPEGEYGAGIVEIFDHGTYLLDSVDYDNKYSFTLHGKKAKGSYSLVKTSGKKFLWIRKKDQKMAMVGRVASRYLQEKYQPKA